MRGDNAIVLPPSTFRCTRPIAWTFHLRCGVSAARGFCGWRLDM